MSTANTTTCVIGDIHGCHTSLLRLLDQVCHRADTLVFLGDYVDRGPDSKAVISTILSLRSRHPRVVPLMGNHDFLFYQYLMGDDNALFLQVGGLQTLTSYGIPPAATREQRTRFVPADHLAFLRSLPLFWEDQHAIYVHAGLQPGRHLSQQSAQWCLWARDAFLASSHEFGKPIVFGHTVFAEPYFAADKIGIDTGAVYGGQLTALLLPEREVLRVPPGETAISQEFIHGS
ncbi:MAG: metallophosphoesterase [Desulfobulbus sp.]|jgi:serine/threonine protein phosphatase 1|uniref:metallophosphoesterase n=1 Tax=Desulfobulbus sp. TaxID=895 RepID=UPI002845B17C|nr:metallophosphoesterase [Desulfobulbus sp.]MDR2550625.1 metallophosphoesterase [Desulfobulbus sp.]